MRNFVRFILRVAQIALGGYFILEELSYSSPDLAPMVIGAISIVIPAIGFALDDHDKKVKKVIKKETATEAK